MNSIFLRQSIYHLKKDYGNIADIYKVTFMPTDMKTGQKQKQVSKIIVKKAILLPMMLSRQLLRSYRQDMNQGGFYSINTRVMIIDKKDLPVNYIFEEDNDYIVVSKKRYDIKVADIAENYVMLTVQETVGKAANEIYTVRLNSEINLTEQVNHE